MIEEVKDRNALRCTGCGAVAKLTSYVTREGFSEYHADCHLHETQDLARVAIKKRVQRAMFAQHQHREGHRLDIAA